MEKKTSLEYNLVRHGAIRALHLNRVREGLVYKESTPRYMENLENTSGRILNGYPIFVGYNRNNTDYVDIYEAIFYMEHDTLVTKLQYINAELAVGGGREFKFDEWCELNYSRKNKIFGGNYYGIFQIY